MTDTAARIDRFSLRIPAMRAFHPTWMAVGAMAAGVLVKGTGNVQQTFGSASALHSIGARFSAEHKAREEAAFGVSGSIAN
jgi:hypothetical protein